MFSLIRQFLCSMYRMIFIDTRTGDVSHTLFWSNVGYGCMCYTFVYAVVHGSTINEWIWALFGVVVIGNRTIIKLFQARFGITDGNKTENK